MLDATVQNVMPIQEKRDDLQYQVLKKLILHQDEVTQGLSIFCVGGAVRDALLGLPAGDRDWVVVGASPEDMIARGFIPVGGDFPVFLHPQTKEEYALARTERKSGRGYQGFTFYTGKDVSLEEDLLRRDFTLNAMAVDMQGVLHDPYQGYEDLQQGVFRHVSEAFIEDPVRILRLGRFLSRFSNFSVALETLALCQEMVENKEVDALVPERVWKELSRALMGKSPSRCFSFLQEIGALERIVPQFYWRADDAQWLDDSCVQEWSLSQRYALWVYLGLLSSGSERAKEVCTQIAKHLRVSREQADYALLLPDVVLGLKQYILHFSEKESVVEGRVKSLEQAQAIVSLIERFDGIRKPERLLDLIQVSALLLRIEKTSFLADWHQWLAQVNAVVVGDIAKQYAGQVDKIKLAIHEARVACLID